MSAAVVELYMENFTVCGMTESDLRSRVVSWVAAIYGDYTDVVQLVAVILYQGTIIVTVLPKSVPEMS